MFSAFFFFPEALVTTRSIGLTGFVIDTKRKKRMSANIKRKIKTILISLGSSAIRHKVMCRAAEGVLENASDG